MSTSKTQNFEFNFKSALLSNYNLMLLNAIQQSQNSEITNLRKECLYNMNNTGDILPPLLNQATFLSHAYICLVWLWESVQSENLTSVLENSNEIINIISIISIVECGKDRKLITPKDYLRLIRNAISHARVVVTQANFQFTDKHPNNKFDFAIIEMEWSTLGLLSDTVFHIIGNYIQHKS